jgi:hypothetical protein
MRHAVLAVRVGMFSNVGISHGIAELVKPIRPVSYAMIVFEILVTTDMRCTFIGPLQVVVVIAGMPKHGLWLVAVTNTAL